MVLAIEFRTFNPLVEGSSPSPVICGSTRQESARAHNAKDLGQSTLGPSSRQFTAACGPVRPSTATRLLPADPDFAAVVNAWDRLPEAVRAGIVALVKAALKGGGR